ncbi:MAG: branched-chain amino acid ABC transporter substrate-binding protein [Acidimicrobiia bacterium]|nr:branched-chain amino acid ABC transporter substrate-binding protein [Acidimicrobiia bacterium]
MYFDGIDHTSGGTVSRSVRNVGVALIVGLVMAACGNSSDDASPASTAASDSGAGTANSDRDEFVSISGVPGVSDDEIAYAVVGTKSNNPLGSCILDCYAAGVEAYFAYQNSLGGIYGRDLVVRDVLDDELGQNQVRALEVISAEQDFGVFQATLLATGWGALDDAGVPTYAWGINATEAANRMHIWPSLPVRCQDCPTRSVPYAAKSSGARHAASLGYGVSENSKVCAQTVAKAIEKYEPDTGVDIVYTNDDLAFGLPNGIAPEVTAMKKAGVDFISTCIDLNGMKSLAQELARQGMDDVVLYHPNSYSQSFVTEADGLFEGDYVTVQFRPFESDPGDSSLTEFLEWMKKQGDEPSEMAMVGWINATQAFDGLLAAGPNFDREKVTAATNAMTDFDAGGLLMPVDWTVSHVPYTNATRSANDADECTVLVKVVDGVFETVGPVAEPGLCWSGSDLAWSEPKPAAFG